MKPEPTKAAVGDVSFVALSHEELVAASVALHRLLDLANAKPIDKDAMAKASMDALNLCLVALWHADECDGDATTFVVMPTPAKILARAMNERRVPQVGMEKP